MKSFGWKPTSFRESSARGGQAIGWTTGRSTAWYVCHPLFLYILSCVLYCLCCVLHGWSCWHLASGGFYYLHGHTWLSPHSWLATTGSFFVNLPARQKHTMWCVSLQVGVKGNPQGFNRGLDCDVIVAEVNDYHVCHSECIYPRMICTVWKGYFWCFQVRSTSHKPDEIYGMIERLSPGTRKIELFGRPHNVQPNW